MRKPRMSGWRQNLLYLSTLLAVIAMSIIHKNGLLDNQQAWLVLTTIVASIGGIAIKLAERDKDGE